MADLEGATGWRGGGRNKECWKRKRELADQRTNVSSFNHENREKNPFLRNR